MNDKIKIVIITAGWRYEGVKKVIECVDNQSYKNWIHIIVNDNNEELREYAKSVNYFLDNPKRIFVDSFRRLHWYGGYSRNIGANMAFPICTQDENEDKNIFLAFFDDDNLFMPDHLESLVSQIDNDDICMVGTDMLVKGTKNKEYSHIIRCQLLGQQCDLGSFIYRRKEFISLGGFFPRKQKKITYDYELITKMKDTYGEKNIKIIHPEVPTFLYYHKER